MAGKAWSSAESLDFFRKLEAEPWRFGFFETLRVIEAQNPDKPGFGRSVRPSEDPVRLGSEPSLKFASSTIAAYRQPQEQQSGLLTQYFFGLFGPNAPLPVHLTEFALQRKHNEGDATLSRFADVFHHRMASLLYRAWASSRPHISFENPEADHFSSFIGSFIGLNADNLQHRDELGDQSKLYFAGVLSSQVRNAESLESVVQDFLCLNARVIDFVGSWMQLPDNCRLMLGKNRSNGTLGQDAVMGSSIWGLQQKFRILLGPLNLEQLKRMLPGGESVRRFQSLVRYFVGDEKDWDVQVVLDKEEVPSVRLGDMGQLGWTSWLGKSASQSNPDDLIFSVRE
jgi:type VI secretion system protein ImpH